MEDIIDSMVDTIFESNNDSPVFIFNSWISPAMTWYIFVVLMCS